MIHNIAITLVDGVGSRTASMLIEAFGSARAIFEASHSELLEAEVSTTIANAIIQNRDQVLQKAQNIANQCSQNGIRILIKGSVEFPKLLAECYDSPNILYVRGNIDFNVGKWVSVVGTRNATQNGVTNTETLIEHISHAYPESVIVSGLAFGIDKAAHSSAINYNLRTVAVMAGWVDDIVPKSHYGLARKTLNSGGAIISDMPPGTIIRGSNFLSRNRIIAGLSHCTIVVESAAKGGSLVTADIAVSYDRELFALPGRIEDTEHQGTNKLIRNNKATLYQDISDIAQTMGWNRRNIEHKNPSNLPGYLLETYSIIPDTEVIILETVCELLDISISEASSRLLQLEVQGFIKSIRGRMYQKAKY